MPVEKKPQIFLSYASENLDMVRKVYEGLVKRQLNVWFDKEHLGPGKWKPQIERAIRRCRYFIICLSNAAIRKTGDEPGFQDHELNEAYEIARNQPEQEFTIIPVRIEDCHRGDHRLSTNQQYDLFPDLELGLDKLVVHIGGVSLSDPKAKDERTKNEKLQAILFAKALSEHFAGRSNHSISLLNSLLDLSPDLSVAWVNKGVFLDTTGKHLEAIQAYDKALSLNPNLASAWQNKALTLWESGRHEEALQAYDQTLKIKPGDADVLELRDKLKEEIRRKK